MGGLLTGDCDCDGSASACDSASACGSGAAYGSASAASSGNDDDLPAAWAWHRTADLRLTSIF